MQPMERAVFDWFVHIKAKTKSDAQAGQKDHKRKKMVVLEFSFFFSPMELLFSDFDCQACIPCVSIVLLLLCSYFAGFLATKRVALVFSCLFFR